MADYKTHFSNSVLFKEAPGAGAAARGLKVSRFAGMPIAAPQLYSEWNVQYLQFNDSAALPQNGVNWAITVIDTDTDGNESIALSDDLFPPHVILTNNDNASDTMELQWTAPDGGGETWNLTDGRAHYFESMVRFRDTNNDEDTVQQMNAFAGVCNTDTNFLATVTDFVGFVHSDGNNDLRLVIGRGGTGLASQAVFATGWTTTGDTGWDANTVAARVARRSLRQLGPNDWVRVAMLVVPNSDGSGGTLYAWVNNVLTNVVDMSADGTNTSGTTVSGPQVPDQNLCISVGIGNGEAVAKIMDVAYILNAIKYEI